MEVLVHVHNLELVHDQYTFQQNNQESSPGIAVAAVGVVWEAQLELVLVVNEEVVVVLK